MFDAGAVGHDALRVPLATCNSRRSPGIGSRVGGELAANSRRARRRSTVVRPRPSSVPHHAHLPRRSPRSFAGPRLECRRGRTDRVVIMRPAARPRNVSSASFTAKDLSLRNRSSGSRRGSVLADRTAQRRWCRRRRSRHRREGGWRSLARRRGRQTEAAEPWCDVAIAAFDTAREGVGGKARAATGRYLDGDRAIGRDVMPAVGCGRADIGGACRCLMNAPAWNRSVRPLPPAATLKPVPPPASAKPTTVAGDSQ